MGKTNPLNDKDMAAFVEGHAKKKKPETENSWTFKMAELDEETFNLSPKNPNAPKEAPLRRPEEILKEMDFLDKETTSILTSLKELIWGKRGKQRH